MKIKILFIALLSCLFSISAHAQGSSASELCMPQDLYKDSYLIDFKEIITLPQFPDCKFEVQGSFAVTKGQFHIYIRFFDIPEEGPCKELLAKLQDDDEKFSNEFNTWFEKQAFYALGVKLYKRLVENNPWNESLYCPNGVVTYSGYFGECVAHAYYKRTNWACPFCACCQITRIAKVACNLNPCCETKLSICMDKGTGEIKISEKTNPIPSECANATPYSIPVDPLSGQAYKVSKCIPLCTDKYPYNAPAPTK